MRAQDWMKRSGTLALALGLSLSLSAGGPGKAKTAAKAPAKAAAAAAAPVKAAEGASLVLKGDSTLHKWDAKASALTITGEASGSDLLAAVKAGKLSALKVSVSVDGLKCNEGKSMDKNLRKTMESEQFPEVTFTLASYTVQGETVTAKGSLRIHGVAKDVELTGVLVAKDGAVSVKGAYALKMSDYGVKPPVMMLGTVKVRDDVTVEYDFALTY